MNKIWLCEEQSLLKSIFNNSELPQFLQDAAEDARRRYFSQMARLRQPLTKEGDLAILDICGPLMTGAAPIDKWNGASDYADIVADAKAIPATGAKAAAVRVFSGGGMAVGAGTAADAIAELATKMPVVVWGEFIASAAYYTASGATAIVMPRDGVAGSIGTITQVLKISPSEGSGVKVFTITPDESDLKSSTNPLAEMTKEQLAWLKESATKINNEFMGFVQKHRPKVEKSSMRGQTFYGSEAVEVGLADANGSWEEAKQLAVALSRIG